MKIASASANRFEFGEVIHQADSELEAYAIFKFELKIGLRYLGRFDLVPVLSFVLYFSSLVAYLLLTYGPTTQSYMSALIPCKLKKT